MEEAAEQHMSEGRLAEACRTDDDRSGWGSLWDKWDAPQEALYMASMVDTRFQLGKADLESCATLTSSVP